MPRPTGLTRPQIGVGHASPGTVDASAFVNPDQGTDGLRVHVNDPNRAHMASSIGIVDAGGYYASDEVEGALQEIGGASSGGRQNGIVTGFGYSAVGRVVTFNTPSTALLPTLRDYSGEIITLPDNTLSIWVYISPVTGLITQFVGANPPTITSPENVLLWQFATLAGAITTAHDARFYVRNLDRKLPFTVRSSGPQADQESEACFVTLDAALTYLTYSATTLNSLRTEVVIRGVVDVTGPVVLPANGIHFQGEDGATLNLIGVGTTLINLNGKNDVTFSDITFTSDVALATAITDTVGGAVNFTMERCSIVTGTQPWLAGIVFGGVIGRATLRDVIVLVTNTGISVANPTGVEIDTCEVTAINFVAGSIGIRMGVTPATGGETPSTVNACTVSGFDSGIPVSGFGHVITGCTVILGTAAAAGVIVGDSQGVTVANCTIDCLTNSGKVGIEAVGTAVNQVLGLKLVGNTITGAAEYGIRLDGFVQESLVTGNLVDCYLPATPEDPTANAGIFVQGLGGATDVPAYLTITGNTVWRAKTGIYLKGDAPRRLSEILVSNNVVHHCAVGVAGTPPVAWEVSVGIGVEWGVGLSLLNNHVYGIGSILKPDGTVVQPTLADVYSEGIILVDCTLSTVQGNKVRDLATKGGGVADGIQVAATGSTLLSITGSVVSGNVVTSIPGSGIFYGIGGLAAPAATDLTGARIAGNTVEDVSAGISVLSLGRSTVTGCRIDGNTVNGTTISHGITITAAETVAVPDGVVSGVEVVGNTVLNATLTGVFVDCGVGASLSNVRVTNNVITLPGADGIAFDSVDAGNLAPLVFTGLFASGNRITMDVTVPNTSGIRLGGIVNTFAGAAFDDNIITNSYDGITVALAGPLLANTAVSDLSVSRNSLTGVRNRGVVCTMTSTLSLAEFAGNQIVNVALGSTQCIYILLNNATPSSAVSSDIIIADNLLRPATGVTAIQTVFDGMKTQGVRIERNDIQGGLVGTEVSLVNSNTGVVPSINGLSVRGNRYTLVETQGVLINVAATSDEILNIDVSSNTFNRVAEDLGSVSSAAILMTLENTTRNLAVRGNQFYSCGRLNGTDGGITLNLNDAINVGVTDNQFSGGLTGVLFGFGTSIILKGNTPGLSLKDVDVSKNTVRNTSLGAPAFGAHIALDLANFTTAYNLSVDGNDIDRDPGSGADCLGIAVFGTLVDYYGLRVNNNRISGADLGTPITLDAIGISAKSIDQGSVSNNYISGTSALGVQGAGINATISDTSRGLSVSGNKVVGETGVTGAGNYGVLVSVTAGALNGSFVDANYVYGYPTNIRVEFTDCTILSVSKNETVAHVDYGIAVDSTGAGGQAANLTVDGNAISTSTTAQTSGVFVTTTNSNSFENLSVCDNQVRYGGVDPVAAGSGVEISSAADISNASLCRNSVFTVHLGVTVTAVNSYAVAIDDNNTQGGDGGIGHFSYGGIIGYSVSGNRVWCRADSTSNLIYIHYNSAGQSLHNATIDGNDVNGGVPAAPSVRGGLCAIQVGTSGSEPDAISVSISSNTIRLSGAGIIAAFASSRSVSLDNNKVDRVTDHGLNLSASLGASAGDSTEVSVSGNLVTRWQQGASVSTMYGIGLTIVTTGANTGSGISILGNNVKGDDPKSTSYYLNLLCHNLLAMVFSNNTSYLTAVAPTRALDLYTGAGTLKNLVFTGNVFRGSTLGIQYTNNAAFPDLCTFTGNIGDAAAAWSQFENGGGAGWTGVLPPAGGGAGQFQNFNIDNGS